MVEFWAVIGVVLIFLGVPMYLGSFGAFAGGMIGAGVAFLTVGLTRRMGRGGTGPDPDLE